MSATSNQYAVALFELAHEADEKDVIQETFEAFAKELDLEEMTFFIHPRITKADKKAVIKAMDMHALFTDFIYVLIDNNRFENIQTIKQNYDKLILEQGKIMRIDVFTKTALDKSRMNQLKKQYEKKYNRQVMIENHIDETIAGGLRVEFDGQVLDNTVNHMLSQLKHRLAK